MSLCTLYMVVAGGILNALNPSWRQAANSRKRFGLSSSLDFITIQSPIDKTFFSLLSSSYLRDGRIITAIVDRLDKVRRAGTEDSRSDPREA